MRNRIVYFLPDDGISGGAAVVLQHIYRLNKLGFKSFVVVTNNKTDFSWFPYKIKAVPYKEHKFNKNDIIVATWWETAFLLADKPAKAKVYFVQSDESRLYLSGNINKELVYLSYMLKYSFITEAKWIQKWLRYKFGIKSEYIPNGIDLSIFNKVEPLKEKSGKLRVLIEGPVDLPWKGIDDAFSVIQGLDCEVWYISSSGRPKEEWKVDEFFYKVPMDKMKYIYSSCDVLLKMSKVEGFFGPPLEMMACGGTAVVTNVTGYDEYIIDGYNALVVDIGDIKTARNRVKSLIKDGLLLRKLQKNGLKTSFKFRWQNSIKKLSIYYKKISENDYGIDYFTNEVLYKIYMYLREIENINKKLSNENYSIKNSRWWKLKKKLKKYYKPLLKIYDRLK